MNLSTLRVINLGRLAGELPKNPPPGIEFVATCRDSAHNILYTAEQNPTEAKSTLFSNGTTIIGWMPQRCEICGRVLIIDLFEQTDEVTKAAINWHPSVKDNVIQLRPKKSSRPQDDDVATEVVAEN